MIRLIRVAAAFVVAAGGLLAARSANAQDAGTTVDCSTLPHPIYVTGSSAFGPTLNAFAAKLAMETTPTTIVYISSSSCAGATAIASGTALTATGTYYLATGAQSPNPCTPHAGTTADLAVSDVFYESCSSTNQAPARPTTLGDIKGPVQAMEIIVPKNNTTGYLTAQEGQVIWGCSTLPSTITTIEATGVFVRGPTSGSQIITAAAIGLDPSAFVGNSTTLQLGSSGVMASTVGGYPTAHTGDNNAVGFLGADVFDLDHASTTAPLIALPFQASGQTLAFYADSAPGTADRKNVRDGHYFPWGYEHLLATVDSTGAATDTGAAKLIGLITGATTDSSFDYVQVEGKAGTIPLCAMAVQKTADVPGYLSPSARTSTCDCAYQAAASGTAPTGCTTCTTGGDAGNTCSGGKTCQHGYCE
jgi:hypothetical protein